MQTVTHSQETKKQKQKKKLHLDQKYLTEPFEVFHQQTHTYLKKKNKITKFLLKGPKIAALEQRYSPCVFKNPISEVKNKITSTKIQI